MSRAHRPDRIRPIDDWVRVHLHPSDRVRRLRHLAGPLLLGIGVAVFAVALVLALMAGAGWIGPEGLRW